ncbi:ribosomal protein L21 [Acidimicrobium ferrooxidans DSM 10331]|uniref:Large ribosomal subunit protein bL21 n=1 Tax=Acidimicrobium ferrooxidans (strain DSM 10331 / JCM 15462 / NBRC 103882 / ICP) TaxID=525909 RepID=C7LYB1_ACIFD|nr:50S ribosomal protein L21 [Acidimicrobium ferrooxidans]ACU53719.1 ribosomal protein L21 [Acidimicrobium ferrooxidans DSM 10331]
MDAIISTGGRQERVREGDEVLLDLQSFEGSSARLTPLAIIDGDEVLVAPAQLEGAYVEVDIVGVAKGPKVRGFTYKAKANERRRYGHRQRYVRVRVTSVHVERAAAVERTA